MSINRQDIRDSARGEFDYDRLRSGQEAAIAAMVGQVIAALQSKWHPPLPPLISPTRWCSDTPSASNVNAPAWR